MSFNYVVGFLFSPDLKKVVLIEKKSPKWQAGLLNGVGGKIEPREQPGQAMIREFYEETGLSTGGENEIYWRHISDIVEENNWSVRVFAAVAPFDDVFNSVKTTTQEEVIICDVHNLPPNVVSNLTWLIPMSIDFFRAQKDFQAYIKYSNQE